MKKDIKLSYYGRVKNGKIELPRKRLGQEVASTFEGRGIEVIFQRKRKRRSSQQNRYYWSVVIPHVLHAFIDLGHDLQSGNASHHEMIHEILKDRFLDNGIELADANGQVIDGPSSTTRCTTTDFMEYLDRITQWAAEALHITIPEPNEQLEIFNP